MRAKLVSLGLIVALGLLAIGARRAGACPIPIIRFAFRIEPNTPERDLLPTPPSSAGNARILLSEDLIKVPEVALHEPLIGDPEFKKLDFENTNDERLGKLCDQIFKGKHKSMASTAELIAKINHLNRKRDDRFIEVLLANRPDLQGLPFVVGERCRLEKSDAIRFNEAVQFVRSFRAQPQDPLSRTVPVDDSKAFWRGIAVAEDQGYSGLLLPRIAALTQLLAPETGDYRLGLADYLSKHDHSESTKALARLAIYSEEANVRRAAVEGLRNRAPRDYTDVLLSGLRYPWPAVAGRAAAALSDLGRTDVVPEVVNLLDQPDPRAPVVKEIGGKKTPVVRELVRINHHRNCLLCHAPAERSIFEKSTELPVGVVPVPDLPIGLFSQCYQIVPDLLVRADVTYLRQDFSIMQKVINAEPWSEMQRFDFLVRTRTVSPAEANAVNDALAKSSAPNPYREAALGALRRLTGTDAGTTAASWRRWLDGKSIDLEQD